MGAPAPFRRGAVSRGALATRIGGQKVIVWAFALWGLMSALTPSDGSRTRAIWWCRVGVGGATLRFDHATELEAAISYDAVRVWRLGEARLNFPEGWPGAGSAYAAASDLEDKAGQRRGQRLPGRREHDGHAAQALVVARHAAAELPSAIDLDSCEQQQLHWGQAVHYMIA